MANSKKTALVISGGGAKGAFAVGVVKYLFEAYRNDGWFQITGGTSTGALIAPLAALMAKDDDTRLKALKTLITNYTTVSTSDILDKQNLLDLIVGRLDCLYESDPLNDLIHKTLKPEWFDWLQQPEAPDCYVVYVNYQNGQKVTVSPKDQGINREQFIAAMRASASVPVVMEATKINGDVCYDGGVRDLLPFGKAIKLGAESIVPVFLDPEEFGRTERKFKRIDKVLLRTLSILVDETGRNDFEMAEIINMGIQAKEELLTAFTNEPQAQQKLEAILANAKYKKLFGSEKRLIELINGLRPNATLTDDSLTFDPVKMSNWLEQGEKKAEEIVTSSPFM